MLADDTGCEVVGLRSSRKYPQRDADERNVGDGTDDENTRWPPTVAMRIPAIAGPTILETLYCVEFSARPAGIWSWVTIEGTMEEKEGMDSASVIPTTRDVAMIAQGCANPPNSIVTITTGQSICRD